MNIEFPATPVLPAAPPPARTDSAYVLTVDCPERPGLVHAVTGFLLEHHGDILELTQFDDIRAGHFFLRIHFSIGAPHDDPGPAALRSAFAEHAADMGADFELRPATERRRVLVMVSKMGHALNDLLYRSRTGDLACDIVAVVSNHPDHRALVEWHGIPYFHVPVTRDTKPQAEEKLLDLVDRFEAELVVLARYMQILSENLAQELTGRAINIHHSFLPSFKGAKPYHQAAARGVKLVGATAHYVNDDLDEGPIIAQQVQQVDHSFGPEQMVAAGQDTECKALSDAVRWHCEGRVFLHGNQTVVLR